MEGGKGPVLYQHLFCFFAFRSLYFNPGDTGTFSNNRIFGRLSMLCLGCTVGLDIEPNLLW